MNRDWTTQSRTTVLRSRWMTVHRDRCRTAGGSLVPEYYVVEKADYAQMVAVTSDRRLVLVRQYKHAAGRVVTELPAGYLDPRETPEDCARRELLEETGFQANQVRPLGVLESSPSVLTTKARLFLCTELENTGRQRLQGGEEIEVLLRPVEDVIRRTRSEGYLADLSSSAALFLALPWLEGE